MRRTALLTVVSLLSASMVVAQTQNQSPQAAPARTTQACNGPCASQQPTGQNASPNTQQQSATNSGQAAQQQSAPAIGPIPPPPAPDSMQQAPQSSQDSTYPENSAPQQTSPGQTTGTMQTQEKQSNATLGTRPSPVTHIPMARTVPVGAEVEAKLDISLSSKTSQVDQPFTATLAQPLRNSNGEVLVPIGAKVQGRVVTVEAGKTLPSIRGKGQLSLRFTDIAMPNGTTLPIQASLLGVSDAKNGKPSANTNEEGQVTGKNSGTNTVKDVGIGAGIGTVAGLIFGSALKGLAIGAIAGGGYVLANGGKDVELPADTGLRLRLDQNLTLPDTGSTR